MIPSYIDLINRFWQLDEQHSFNPEQTRLYFYLLKVANASVPAWPDSFERADNKVAADNGIKSVNTMKKYRDRLIEVGLIHFEAGGKGQSNRGRYQVRYQKLTPKPAVSCQILTPNLIPKEPDRCQNLIPNLTPKKALVSSKVSKFDTYSIYKRLKTIRARFKKIALLKALKKKVGKAPLVPRVPPKPANPNDPFFLKGPAEKCNVPYSNWIALYSPGIDNVAAMRIWPTLTDDDRLAAMKHTPGYIKVTPPRWRKSAVNYLTDKKFLDTEIISREDNIKSEPDASNNGPREIIRTEFKQQGWKRSRNTGDTNTDGRSNAA